ncbi:MAG: NAD-dependent epimerase/dehydratase family protein [Kofleriaceae bacterium]
MSSHVNLVTGAAGFSGSYVVRELLAKGERVLATDRADALANPRVRETLAATGMSLEHPNLKVQPADLLEPESLKPLFSNGVTRVYHTASLYDYSAPLEKLINVNVNGTTNLLKALGPDRYGKLDRFVHWSTCGVFGKPYTAADRGKTNVPFTEDSPSPKTEAFGTEQPSGSELVNDYSIAKWQQEQIMWKEHRDNGLPLTVVRPAPIYGPGSTYGHGGIIMAIANGIVPAIPTDAKNYISASVHVSDIAGFAVYIANKKDSLGQDYNIVDNSVVSYYEFVHYIALLTGRKLVDLPFINLRRARHVMIPAAKAMNWVTNRFGIKRVRVFEPQSANYVSSSYWLSNRKSLTTGYQYRYPEVREGLKDTIAWMRENGWLTDKRRLFA